MTPDTLELEDLHEAAVDDMVQVAAPVPIGSRTMKAKSAKADAHVRSEVANDIDLTPVDMAEQGDPPERALKTAGYAPRASNAALAMREMAYTRRRAAKMSRIRTIWICALVVLLAALIATVALRHLIVETNPGAARIFAALGFDMTPAGFDIGAVEATRLRLDGREYLTVEGNVRNTGREDAVAPMVQMRLLDGDGTELASWTVDAGAGIPAGETQPFRTELPNPPVDAAQLVYSFEGDVDMRGSAVR